MKTIELTDEQWETLQSGEDIILKAKPQKKQWEPKGGIYLINNSGVVIHRAPPHVITTHSQFGMCRSSRKQAEKARDDMRIYHRLLAYRDEFDPDYEPDWSNPEIRKCCIRYDHTIKKYYCAFSYVLENVDTVYMSEHVANKLVEKLNSGEVVL